MSGFDLNKAGAPAALPLSCGIVMPISAIDGCAADHWVEVKEIIQDAIADIEEPKFVARLVSDADDIGVIQKRIVQGVYNSDVVVCDVSGKNPNVMFELGMRLAFDKPTVIIKDDKTDYSFDTAVIEHITYPRDLRFQRMVDFKRVLAQKVLATYQAALRDPEHSTFLKNFGTFKVAQLHEKEASAEHMILDAVMELQSDVATMRRTFMNNAINSGDIQNYQNQELPTVEAVDKAIQKVDSALSYQSESAIKEAQSMRAILVAARGLPNLSKDRVEKIEKLLSEMGEPLLKKGFGLRHARAK